LLVYSDAFEMATPDLTEGVDEQMLDVLHVG
jgi:hypothetical protein